MLDKIMRVIKSGGLSFNATVTMGGMTVEQAQQDAMSFYVWKLQRVIREATPAEQTKWAKDGIVVHYTEVGKKVATVTTTVEKLSDQQAREAYELLKAKLGM